MSASQDGPRPGGAPPSPTNPPDGPPKDLAYSDLSAPLARRFGELFRGPFRAGLAEYASEHARAA